jgi:hypothetical protein
MLDVPAIQNRLSDIGCKATLITKRIEQAQGCLGLGDIAADTELELAIAACDRCKHELTLVKEGIKDAA